MLDDPLADAGVVVVTYASADDIEDCLAALPVRRLGGGVVVVDNASPDDTADRVARLALPGVELRREPRNRGFGAGCNAGFALLRARLDAPSRVLFLNPDARVTPADLERLVAFLAGDPRLAVAGPRLVDGDGVPQPSAGRLGTLATELRYAVPRRLVARLPDRRLPAGYDVSGPVGYVEGACFVVDAAAFERVGGFDEAYFLFFEEQDLAQRLGRAGYDVALCADAWATHRGGASRAHAPHAARPEYVRSTRRYLRRWRGRPAAAVYQLVAAAWWWWQGRTGRLDPGTAAAYRAALRAR